MSRTDTQLNKALHEALHYLIDDNSILELLVDAIEAQEECLLTDVDYNNLVRVYKHSIRSKLIMVVNHAH